MRNLFTYYFKKNWPFLVFISIAGIIINFILLTDSNGYYYIYDDYTIVYDPPLDFAIIFAAIISTLLPIINFSFKMKKINVDLMYSLPIKRSKLYLTTLLFSLIEILIPITLVYFQSFFNVVCSDHLYNLSYFLLFYPVLLFISIGLCCIVSFIYCRNNTVVDGVVNVGMFSLAPLAAIYAIQSLLSPLKGTYFVKTFLDGSYYSIYTPFFTMSDTFFQLIEGNKLQPLSYQYNGVILATTILFILVSIASVFGLLKFASIDKAENTMQKSTSAFSYKVMIPILTISLLVITHDEIDESMGYILVGAVVMYCFYHRTVKLHWKKWLLIIGYVLIGIILAIMVNNFIRPPYMPYTIQSILH